MKQVLLIYSVCSLLTVGLQAQLWPGGLGDPVLSITFGEGANPGPALPAGSTSYSFSGNQCPQPGEYSLLNLTFACFNNNWHTLSGDHTPNDAGGYYMLLHGTAPGALVAQATVHNLCSTTRYQLSAWVKNPLRPAGCAGSGTLPQLLFTVETPGGTVVHSYQTDPIAAVTDPQWTELGFTFLTGVQPQPLVIKVKSVAPYGCGNAIAIDDITLRPCGQAVTAAISPGNLPTLTLCEGNTATTQLTAALQGGYGNNTYQWQQLNGSTWTDIAGATNASLLQQAQPPGSYTYRVLVGTPGATACRVASTSLFVHVLKKPFVQATNYVYGCLGSNVQLQASGANSYRWSGPNGFTSDSTLPVLARVTYAHAGAYKVTGTTHQGCSNTDSTLLQIFPNATATSAGGGFVCEGAPIRLQAGGGVRYAWQPSGTLSNDTIANPVAKPLQNTAYTVTVTNQFGCTDTAVVQVMVWKKPVADAGADVKTMRGLPVALSGSAAGSGVSWYWTPLPIGRANTLQPLVNPAATTHYTLHVVSAHGCGTATDRVQVKVFDQVEIPNAFSPNGDGINDVWNIEPLNLLNDVTVSVYDRTGRLVYRTRGYQQPWNGTRNGSPLPAATYYYVIELGLPGRSPLGGSVTILR